MARRRKNSSTLEVILDLFARLPWWVGPPIALISYLYFHSVATANFSPSLGDPSEQIVSSLYRALSSALQYLLPLAILLGSLNSGLQRFTRASLFKRASGTEAAAAINNMNWFEFELLIGEAFRRQGYTVSETNTGADGGIDLVLNRNGETHLVQCKHWKASKVSVQVVREFYGVIASKGAAGGFVITSGKFTAPAWSFVKGLNLTLIGDRQLLDLIKGISPPAKKEVTPAVYQQPNCPKCGGGMVVRTAKKGPNAGDQFLGCDNFPRCRGTQPLI
tara:strand:- start:7219 stop:8046 length:828 start_codon:yes stop_codon:yes gene_type:complete